MEFIFYTSILADDIIAFLDILVDATSLGLQKKTRAKAEDFKVYLEAILKDCKLKLEKKRRTQQKKSF